MAETSNEPNIYVNDEVTPLRTRLMRAIKGKSDFRGVKTVNEKLIVFKTNNEKLVFDNLYKLQRWDPLLFSNASNSINQTF